MYFSFVWYSIVKRNMKLYLTVMLLFIFVVANMMNNPFPTDRETWAYNKIKEMTLEEKISQLFFLRAQSNWENKDVENLENIINKYQIGGVIFFKGRILDQAIMTNRFQKVSKIPLFIAMDGETGLGMRLEDGIKFPKQMTLGALRDNDLIYEMGLEVGREMKRLGVNINFAPVVDINTNPSNPVIGERSFGDNKDSVKLKAIAYMKGLQEAGIIACAKHFPGHGSTDVDSHLDLPMVSLSKEEIFNNEIEVYRDLIKNRIGSIMVAHVYVPSLENRKGMPASLSKTIINGIIRDSFNYKGLVITDALEMKGIANYYSSGESAVEAFLAGNDILELPENFEKAFSAIKNAVIKGKITTERLESSLMRILLAKYDQGLYEYKEIDIQNIEKNINDLSAYDLKKKIYNKSMTGFINADSLIPFTPDKFNNKIALLTTRTGKINHFQNRLLKYFYADKYLLNENLSSPQADQLLDTLNNYDYIIVDVQNTSKKESANFGLNENSLSLINTISVSKKTVLVNFGIPYLLKLFYNKISILQAYEADSIAQETAALTLVGANEINGKLPVNVNDQLKEGSGILTGKLNVLGYGTAYEVGIDGEKMEEKIDTIISQMIKTGAAPGCEILVAKNGKIIFDKSYGYTTYQKEQAIQKDMLWDMASVTKVMATNMAVMKLHDEKKISIFDNISKYLNKGIETSNKKDIRIIDALSHHAGLAAWIAAYKSTIDTIEGKHYPSFNYYRNKPEGEFNVKVAENLYLRRDYIDTMWMRVLNSSVQGKKKYKYSDLGLIIIKEMIENIVNQPLDKYLNDSIYNRMGLRNTTFKPLEKFDVSRIVPTENDQYWRNQEIRGNVHDMWAAMLGGVSGHAGLFSTANDLARLSQMMLNGGIYGKTRFFDYPTVYTFTTRFYISTRRGIGWDMKELDKNKECNISDLASPSTYGHQGFTGTNVWIDPENQLIYIFLSNRTYPTMENNKLTNEKYRTKIQTAIYKSFIDSVN